MRLYPNYSTFVKTICEVRTLPGLPRQMKDWKAPTTLKSVDNPVSWISKQSRPYRVGEAESTKYYYVVTGVGVECCGVREGRVMFAQL